MHLGLQSKVAWPLQHVQQIWMPVFEYELPGNVGGLHVNTIIIVFQPNYQFPLGNNYNFQTSHAVPLIWNNKSHNPLPCPTLPYPNIPV